MRYTTGLLLAHSKQGQPTSDQPRCACHVPLKDTMPPRFRPIVAALALALCAPMHAQTQVIVDAGRGPVMVRLPASYNGQQPIPLLVMLHAYLQTPAELESFMGITAAANANGIATCRL